MSFSLRRTPRAHSFTLSQSMLRLVFIISALALALPTMTLDPVLTLGGMCVFEACVGIYWPAIGTVKSQVACPRVA